MSTLKADTIQSTSGGAATLTKQSATKVWLNLNGTGTIATRDSFNVSGVVDNGTGNYTTSFTSSFDDANYSHAHTNISEDNQFSQTNNTNFVQATGSIQQRNGYWSGVSGENGSSGDSLYFYIQEFGDLA
jgi:hypothetical protein|tara:strand:- start:222 stop:611 length:390 start_codon:yes stop_codon:yes gene_type:complete